MKTEKKVKPKTVVSKADTEEKEVVKRLTPGKETLNLLFSLSGNECAFPDCHSRLFNDKYKLVGQIAHIEAAMPGGERFNENSTNEDRRHFRNLLALCYDHHIETDDVDEYKVADLQKMKAEHEAKFSGVFFPKPEHIDNAFEVELKKSLQRVEESTIRIESSLARQDPKMDAILNAVNQLVAKSDVQDGAGSTDFNARLDTILEYRNRGEQRTAISLFESLKTDSWKKLSAVEKYRLLALKGICYVDLVEFNLAADCFLEGLKYQPENPKAINWAILGYSIRNESDQAMALVQSGLALDPLNTGILSSKVRLSKEEDVEKIIAALPPSVTTDAEIAYEIAIRFKKAGDFRKGIKWLHKALLVNEKGKTELQSALATIILEEIFDLFRVQSGQLSEQERQEAELVIKLYTEAWPAVEHTDMAKSRAWYLINRGVAKRMTGNMDGYVEDSLLATSINGDYPTLLHYLKVCAELGLDQKIRETLVKLRAIALPENLVELDMVEANAALNQGNAESAEQIFIKLLERDLTQVQRKLILIDLISIFLKRSDLDTAEAYLVQLENILPNELSTMTIRARLDDWMKKTPWAAGLLEVYSKVNDKMPNYEVEAVARDLQQVKHYPQAIDLYERIVDQDIYSPLMERLLNLYYQAGESKKVLEASKRLLELNGPIRQCTELASYVHEGIHDYESAIETCRDYLVIYPDDQQIRARLSAILFRTGDMEALKSEMQHFRHLDKNLPVDIRFQLCRQLLAAGMVQRATDFAYELRREYFDLPQVHDNFIKFGLELGKTERDAVILDAVTIDQVVAVKTGADTGFFIIEDRPDPMASRGEVSNGSYVAQQLLGRKVGDSAALHERYPDSISVITGIQHKFSHAIQESMTLARTTFAAHSGLRSFSFPENASPDEMIHSMIEMLERMSGKSPLIDDLYKKGQLPLGTVCVATNKNAVAVWKEYTSSPEKGLFTTADPAEMGLAFSNLRAGKKMVMDVFSLLTIFELGVEGYLAQLPNQKVVVRTTLEQLTTYLQDQQPIRLSGQLNINRTEAGIVRTFTTAEEIQADLAKIEKIVAWIAANCLVVTASAGLNMNEKQKQKLDGDIGECFIDVILTAQDQEALLYSEEWVIRALAFQEHQVNGCASFMIIIYLFQSKLIDDDKFAHLASQLIGLNYKLLPANSQILLICAEMVGYELMPVLELALKGIISPFLPGDTPVALSLSFITQLFKTTFSKIPDGELLALKNQIVKRILELLCQRYPKKALGPIFISALAGSLGNANYAPSILEAAKAFFDDNGN